MVLVPTWPPRRVCDQHISVIGIAVNVICERFAPRNQLADGVREIAKAPAGSRHVEYKINRGPMRGFST